MNVTAEFAGRIGGAVRAAAEGKGLGWYGHHMAAATRAVLERVPLVDLTLEVRDARVCTLPVRSNALLQKKKCNLCCCLMIFSGWLVVGRSPFRLRANGWMMAVFPLLGGWWF